MKSSLYVKMAARSLRSNRRFYLPYLLSCVLCSSMLYVLLSLTIDPALEALKGGTSVRTTLALGCVVMAIFASALLFYTSGLVTKSRKREFGLYNVLGMEKRHIGRMLLCESAFTFLLALGAGVGLGVLFSWGMLHLLTAMLGQSLSFRLSVQLPALVLTALWTAAAHGLILLNNLRVIRLAQPIELLRGTNEGEREPKAKYLTALLGLVCLIAGYVLSVTITSPVKALVYFFVAVLLVIAGTYLLFIALSVLVLRFLRAKKKFYYRTDHFVTVSGMLHRMKRNAAGLASICILSTMVLVTISTTLSLYVNSREILDMQFPRDVQLTGYSREEHADAEAARQAAYDEAERQGLTISRFACFTDTQTWLALRGGVICEYDQGDPCYVWATDRAGYESLSGEPVSLEDGQALYYRAGGTLAEEQTLSDGRTYRMTRLSSFPYASGMETSGEACVYLVLPDGALDGFEYTDETIWFDLTGSEAQKIAYAEKLDELTATRRTDADGGAYTSSHLVSRQKNSPEILSFFGAFFFLGLFLGTMFLLATALIIYYKQVSEGFDDQRAFSMLRKVGMTDAEVRATIHTQVMLVFFLPLGAAACHTAFAFPMIKGILTLFGMSSVTKMLLCQAGTLAAFALVYWAVYTLTARAYYSIVHAG